MIVQKSVKKQKVPGTTVKKDNKPKGQFGNILEPDAAGFCLGPKKEPMVATKGGYSENPDSCVIP